MSTVINITDFAKDILGNSSQIQNYEDAHLIAITINLKDLREKRIDGGDIYLKENPQIHCQFTFQIFGGLLHRYIKFTSRASLNRQYLVTMYHLNYRKEIELTETIKVLNSRLYTTNYFTYNYDVLHNEEKHLINNNLCMFCKIKEIKASPIEIEIIKNEMPAKFLSLYEEKKLTDFKIICDDKEFCVHKIILVCQSDVFRAMLENPMKEFKNDELIISDFYPKIVEVMIRYLYSDTLTETLSEEELKELLLIANKYNLENLKKISFKEICKVINTFKQAVDLLSFTECYNFTDMRDLIIKFMRDNKNILL
ncbi:speckle-type POZ protein-like [Leptopilina heterotoma]|uniref:speckle-type POZ protein-like n=1 Tax=Leptopilina heterotoma TaxID=63436 RepID=UPI001CA8A08F|nr:speckle-type POZ protein-like [Leptopilina heterotoma]